MVKVRRRFVGVVWPFNNHGQKQKGVKKTAPFMLMCVNKGQWGIGPLIFRIFYQN